MRLSITLTDISSVQDDSDMFSGRENCASSQKQDKSKRCLNGIKKLPEEGSQQRESEESHNGGQKGIHLIHYLNIEVFQ